MSTVTAPDRTDVVPAHAGPVERRDRIASIDVLRGVALLGILVMNIQSFSMPDAAYLNPSAYGDLTGANFVVWAAGHLLTDEKMYGLFSMLFGAGILWQRTGPVRRGDARAADADRRRNLDRPARHRAALAAPLRVRATRMALAIVDVWTVDFDQVRPLQSMIPNPQSDSNPQSSIPNPQALIVNLQSPIGE